MNRTEYLHLGVSEIGSLEWTQGTHGKGGDELWDYWSAEPRVNCLVGWSVLELGLTVGRGVQSYSVVDESIFCAAWKEPSIIARS